MTQASVSGKPNPRAAAPLEDLSAQKRSALASSGKPSAKGNANDLLAAALGGEIIAGVYPPGSRLPSEASLLERFKVSRPTLREAFRVLAAKGLIVSRQKVGTSVRPKSDWNMLDPDFLAWHLRAALNENFVNDLFQLRQMVEPQAAYLAAQTARFRRRSSASAPPMPIWSVTMATKTVTDADLRFHQAILDATGNLFIGALGGLIDTALVGHLSARLARGRFNQRQSAASASRRSQGDQRGEAGGGARPHGRTAARFGRRRLAGNGCRPGGPVGRLSRRRSPTPSTPAMRAWLRA